MQHVINPLNANPEKWSNTLKQIVGNLATICSSVFDHFMNLALKGLRKQFIMTDFLILYYVHIIKPKQEKNKTKDQML